MDANVTFAGLSDGTCHLLTQANGLHHKGATPYSLKTVQRTVFLTLAALSGSSTMIQNKIKKDTTKPDEILIPSYTK